MGETMSGPHFKVVAVVPGIGDGKLDIRWLFKIVASNGHVLCRSARLYKTKEACLKAVSAVKATRAVRFQP
jgi:uncharacterized protein YegP (UPF0339 family)